MEAEVGQEGVTTAGEDRGIVDRENRHRLELGELRVLDTHREGDDAVSGSAEADYGVLQHQAHDEERRRRRRHGGERRRGKRQRRHPLDVAGERREVRDEALESVDDDEAVVEDVRAGDLDAIDEDLVLAVAGDGETAIRSDRLDFGAKS